MQTIFFMPWVALSDPIDIGDMRFTPYIRASRARTVAGLDKSLVDTVLAAYGNIEHLKARTPFSRINAATIISWPSDTSTEISQEQVQTRLEQTQVVTFCGVAERSFIRQQPYCNSDTYQTIAQSYTQRDDGYLAVNSRRRDGHACNVVTTKPGPRYIRPFHVDYYARFAIDQALAEALVSQSDGELKQRIARAIRYFLLANTDNDAMMMRSEMVFIRMALDELLGIGHSAQELRKALNVLMADILPSPGVWSPSTGSYQREVWHQRWPKAERPFGAWLSDFADVRNSSAHGSIRPSEQKAAVWPIQYHLLFASWLFPFLVKMMLSKSGVYVLTRDDKTCLRGCERFITADLLGTTDGETQWSRIARSLT